MLERLVDLSTRYLGVRGHLNICKLTQRPYLSNRPQVSVGYINNSRQPNSLRGTDNVQGQISEHIFAIV